MTVGDDDSSDEEDSAADNAVGLDSPDDDYVPEPEMDQAMDQANDQDETAKDAVVQDRLKGQTIRTANLEIKDDGGALVMDLVSSKLPCRIEWSNDGRIVFNYKNTKYVVRK